MKPVACMLVILLGTLVAHAEQGTAVDVLVYGATPGGISASLAAARQGHRVLLIEPHARIGGMSTNGLSHPDFRTFEAITGTFREFTQRVLAYYQTTYGPESEQVKVCLRGTHAEPKVSLKIFRTMLAEQPTLRVLTRTRLSRVQVEQQGQSHGIISLSCRDDQERLVTLRAAVYIDGSYEGDLMAAAGVPYRIGREGREEYGESLAPEKADGQVQGYNFRLTMTNDPSNRVHAARPPGYVRQDYLPLLPLLQDGRIERPFFIVSGGSRKDAIYKVQRPNLPNRKYDINDMSHGLVRLSLPQINNGWPDGDHLTRQQIFAEHVRHNVGMIYFLQQDAAVPEGIRDQAREWGFCRDEFIDNHHLPEQLYVREARRMVGMKVFTEKSVQGDPNDVRAVFVPDAIAMGDYGPNCHGTAHEGPRFGGRHTGEFYAPAAPYQIPYGVLISKRCTNLIVPVAVSASHVGFCALRLEPIWMSLGQASGIAAHLAVSRDTSVQEVTAAEIRDRLHQSGAATIYVSDVPHESEDFLAVQWWGALGGFHGVTPRTGKYGQRGEHYRGQYFHAFVGHAVERDNPIDENLRQKWLGTARKAGLPLESLRTAKRRGDFIRRAHRLSRR